MGKKKNIKPTVNEVKLRLGLYNSLSMLLSRSKRDDCRTILSELDKYVKHLHSTCSLKPELLLLYAECAKEVYHYLYKTKGLNGFDGINAEIRQHINDVFTTILKEHDAD